MRKDIKGEKIREILLKKNIKITELAEMLGESPQNMSATLKSENVKTGTLERISEATGIPLGEFYGQTFTASATGRKSVAVAGNGNSVNTELQKSLRSRDEQINRLLNIIENMQGAQK